MSVTLSRKVMGQKVTDLIESCSAFARAVERSCSRNCRYDHGTRGAVLLAKDRVQNRENEQAKEQEL